MICRINMSSFWALDFQILQLNYCHALANIWWDPRAVSSSKYVMNDLTWPDAVHSPNIERSGAWIRIDAPLRSGAVILVEELQKSHSRCWQASAPLRSTNTIHYNLNLHVQHNRQERERERERERFWELLRINRITLISHAVAIFHSQFVSPAVRLHSTSQYIVCCDREYSTV